MKNLLMILCFLSLPNAYAAHTAPTPTSARATAGLYLLEEDFDSESDSTFTIEGNMLVAGYSSPVDKKLGFYGYFGLLVDGETSGAFRAKDGTGFRFGAGVSYMPVTWQSSDLALDLALQRDQFNFKWSGRSVAISDTNIAVGGLFRYHLNSLSALCGLRLNLKDDGEWQTRYDGVSYTSEIERSETLNLRLGALFHATPTADLRAEFLLFGQESIVVAADFSL